MSPKIKLPDLTDVEDPGNFSDLPKGLYVFKTREFSTSETGESSKYPGQPMGVVVLDPVRVVGGNKIKSGEYQGLFHRFPLDDQNPGWTPRLREFAKAYGIKLKGGVVDSSKVEGTNVIGKVKDGKGEDGERRAEISALMPYTEEAAGGAADDDDDDVGEDDLWTEEELEELDADELKEAAEELEVAVPAGKFTAAKKKKLIAAILEAQEEEDEDEDEDGDEDGDGDDEAWDEESLMEASKDELAEAAAEFEVEMPKRLTDAARKRVVAAILEAQNGDEEDDDEDEDGDEESYTEEDLNEMDKDELKEAAEEVGADFPAGKFTAAKKKKLIAAILEAQDGNDDEEDGEEDDDEEDDGYDDMTKTQLAKDCRSRGIKVRKGMSEDAMREALRENDAENEDEDEGEDEDEELDPDSMDVDEIKAALRERGIAVKGSEKVLRAKLVKALEADDDGDPF